MVRGGEVENGIDVLRERISHMADRLDDHVEQEEKWQASIDQALQRNDVNHAHLAESATASAHQVDKLYTLSRWAWGAAMVVVPLVTGLLVYIFKTHAHG